MNIFRYKWEILFDTTDKSPIFAGMKNNLLGSYKHIVIIYWILVSAVYGVQTFRLYYAVEEALLITFSVCSVVILVNHLLSDYFLTKAMREKNMPFFFVHFAWAVLLKSFIIACIFHGFRYLEGMGMFTYSGRLPDTDTFEYDFIMLIPSMVVTSLGFCGLRFYYEHARVEKANRELQFKTLQDQITPHFMFNVLNHIHVLMEEDVALASSLLEKYAEILRYQLYQGQKEFIRLEQEVQFLKNYIEVEQIRWEDKLDVTCCWQTTDESIEIPPLLLITFIENAFKHVSRCSSAKGYVHLDLTQRGRRLSLVVENSTSPLESEKEASGLGLVNVRKRLDILYHKNYALTCRETDTTYCSQLTLNL